VQRRPGRSPSLHPQSLLPKCIRRRIILTKVRTSPTTDPARGRRLLIRTTMTSRDMLITVIVAVVVVAALLGGGFLLLQADFSANRALSPALDCADQHPLSAVFVISLTRDPKTPPRAGRASGRAYPRLHRPLGPLWPNANRATHAAPPTPISVTRCAREIHELTTENA
jgi:hypothetical protein